MQTEMKKENALRIWSYFQENRAIYIPKRPLFNRQSKLFTMGSCFAKEIQKALSIKGFTLLPDYARIRSDGINRLFHSTQPEWTNHYNTFSIRQEFELAFGVRRDTLPIHYKVSNAKINQIMNATLAYFDPLRQMSYGRTLEDLKALANNTADVIRTAIEQAEIYIITLGLTEIWQHTSGLVLCKVPKSGLGGGDLSTVKFRQSTVTENLDNVRAVLDMILSHFPQKHVVLTVSPVPLGQSFAQTDIGTANTESKAILRAVAGQLSKERPKQVTYFPSYEMATLLPGDIYMSDKRHIRPEFAAYIIDGFLQGCLEGG